MSDDESQKGSAKGILCGGRKGAILKSLLFSAVAFLAFASLLFGQAKPGQTVANIPTDNGTISVVNEENKIVNLKVGDTNFPLDAEEALSVANWIKEGKSSSYSGKGPVSMKREKDSFVITLGTQETTDLRLNKEWAYQLAQALASGRMNVSDAGKTEDVKTGRE